jgi:glycerol uptake facilitator-like aquaporin
MSRKAYLILIGITVFFTVLTIMQMTGVDINSNKDVGSQIPPTATPTPAMLQGAIIQCSANDNMINGKCVNK